MTLLLSDSQWTGNGTCCCHHPAGVAVGLCPDGETIAWPVLWSPLACLLLGHSWLWLLPLLFSGFSKPVSGCDCSGLFGTGADWSSHSAFMLGDLSPNCLLIKGFLPDKNLGDYFRKTFLIHASICDAFFLQTFLGESHSYV